MRATISTYIEAAKRRKKEETGEEGFSLIELIIVVVIIAILAAIAIPIFLNIQQDARNNSLKAITANAATQVAAAMAKDSTITDASTVSVTNLTNGTNPAVTLTVTGSTLDTICVVGRQTGTAIAQSGPGCGTIPAS